MSDDKSTLQLVAENLALALQPLREAVQDVDSFEAFLYGLGWNVSDLPPSYAALGALVDDALAALEQLGSSPDATQILTLLGKVKDVHAAVEALNDVPAGADAGTFLAEFAGRLFELLLARYLAVKVPTLFGWLRLLGIIVLEPFPETPTRPAFVRIKIDYDVIPDIVGDPQSIPKRVYGWGTDSIGFDLIASQLQSLLVAMHIPVSVEQVEPDLGEGYQDPAKTEEIIANRVKVAFLGTVVEGVPVELALAVLPYPAEDGKPAGVIVQPDVPQQLGADYDITDSLKFTLRAGTTAAQTFGVIVRPGELVIRYPFQPGTTLPSAGFGAALHYAPATKRTVLGTPDATRVEIGGADFGLDVDERAGTVTLRLAADTKDLALVLDSGESDSFLQKVLGGGSHTFPIPLTIAWSSRTGFGFGDTPDLGFAFAPHLQLGPIRIETLKAGLKGSRENGSPALTAPVTADVGGALGPVAFSAQDVGAQLKLVFAAGNAGPFDIAVGFKPPNGLGLEVDAVAVKGGGFLFFDNDKKQYAGVLELSLEDTVQLKVIGILTTILPGGQPGFSLLLIITAEFEPIQLGFGFTLDGVGGLAGINRTMLLDVLRAGLRNRTLDSVLFPPDPVTNAPKIISDLSTIFPPAEGRYAFGPQLKIGWGTPTLITAAVGIFIELPPPIRLAILAQITAVLPEEEAPLIEIHMDAIGTYEQEKKRLAVDATLYDSQIVGYPLTGDMAMRLTWGEQPFFALSIGGFNPRYSVPSGVEFPQLHRLELSIGSSRVRLNLDTYLAVTSNTAQFGARLELRVGDGAGLHGWLGFDALFVFSPFSFVADISAGVDLVVGGAAVMTIHLNATLSGPTPWHANGNASIDCFFFSISVPFDVRWGSDEGVSLPDVDVRPPLIAALGDTRNWTAAAPADRELAATLRAVTPPEISGTDSQVIVAHPFSRLTVRERLVPLDVRIDKFGNAAPAKWNQFRIVSGQLNSATVTPGNVQDYFPRAQFIDMPNDEKLSRPSFELLDAGAAFGSSDVKPGASSPLEVHYETFIIDDPLLPSRRGPLYRLGENRFFSQLPIGAAGRSKAWTTGARKYLEPTTVSAVDVREPGYLIAGTGDLAPRADLLGAATSRLQAEQRLADHLAANPADRGTLQVVPAEEVLT